MGLIACPDCKAQISDLAEVCIKCGRPMRSQSPPPDKNYSQPAFEPEDEPSEDGLLDRVSEAGKSAARVAFDAVGEAAEWISDTTGEALNWSGSQARAVRDRLKEESEKLTDRVLPECEVPTILLPAGSRAPDFFCVFEFDQVISQLKGGRLTRPILTVWAARSDIDRVKLSYVVREQFTLQLDEQKRRVAAESSSVEPGKIKALENTQKEADEGVRAGAFTAIAALMFMLFVTNPIFDLVLLSLAVFGGSSATVDSLRGIGASLRAKRARSKLKKQRERLESELDENSDRFQQAVANMEIRVHPNLQALLLDFADLDSVATPPEDAATETGPWVKKYLQDQRYRDQLPNWYQPLLDQHLETM
jgi:hypothetical protein